MNTERDVCAPYKCVKKFKIAMATNYTDQHWLVDYSDSQGIYHVRYGIYVGKESYRDRMERDGFRLVHSFVEGDRNAEFWIQKE
jgi:hypothetical protein